MQTHYNGMQEVMRREAAEREKIALEAARLRRENRQMAVEIEGLREVNGQVTCERDTLKGMLREYEGLREQLVEADKTMEQ